MSRVKSQMASYRNSRAQITTDSEQDTNETDTTKTNKHIKEYIINYNNIIIIIVIIILLYIFLFIYYYYII
jgi:hypothetical protein